jgi:hypothetical protein
MKKNETIQVGLRIDKRLFDRLESLSEHIQIDRMSIIREAVVNHVLHLEEAFRDAITEDYVRLRLNDDEYKKKAGIKEIPYEIRIARKARLDSIAGTQVITNLPKKEKQKRQIIESRILKLFNANEVYSEMQVNEILCRHGFDAGEVRRWLVDLNYFKRTLDGSQYKFKDA